MGSPAYYKQFNKIKNELRKLNKKLESKGHTNSLNEARRLINLKYGQGWREELALKDMKEHPELWKFPKFEYFT